MEKTVSFFSGGHKLCGTLFAPDTLTDGEKRSAIIFCSGFTGLRDTSLLAHSRLLCQQGFMGLSFDHRGFGDSEGPKWRLIPMEQVEDIRSAITFLQQQPCVDRNSIGLFGTGSGGMNAIYAAAVDERARCIVSNISPGNGGKWLKGFRKSEDHWKDFLAELEEDRVRRVVTGAASRMVDFFHIQYMEPGTAQYEEVRRLKYEKSPKTARELPLETAEAVIECAPEEIVHRIAPRPILFIAAEKDRIVPTEQSLEVYERAGQPKKFVLLRGATHEEAYYKPPYPQQTMDEALAWFSQYMPAIASQRPLD